MVSRRDFLKLAGAGALAAGSASAGPFFLFARNAQPPQKTLKILQWKHFVPGYDEWFDGVFARQWGEKNETKVLVDHLPVEQLEAQAAAEVAARRGHDLFMFAAPPANFESHVIDHRDVYLRVQQRHGQMVELAHKSTYNLKTKKYFAFSDCYIPAPSIWRLDAWTSLMLPLGPTDYEMLRTYSRKIRENTGLACGLSLASELDANVSLRALLWSFGGSEQDEAGNVTINSKPTVDALKYMRALYKESEAPEVLTWAAGANVKEMLDGKLSFTMNAISLTRRAERDNPAIAKRLMTSPALRGPAGWLACPHVTSCYVIWNFAENQKAAQDFLVDLIDNYKAAFAASESCNFPSFPGLLANLREQLISDPKAEPHYKYVSLDDTLHWTQNLGYPGYSTAASAEVFSSFVIPRIFAAAAKGDLSPHDAAAAAEKEMKAIFRKWSQA